MFRQDLVSDLKTAQLGELTVGATSTLTPVIDLRYCNSMKIAYNVKTLTGTKVNVEKIVCSKTGAFAGEEIDITDFVKGLTESEATTINTIKTNGAKDSSVGIYNYAKVSFKSDVAGAVIYYSIELGGFTNLPVQQ